MLMLSVLKIPVKMQKWYMPWIYYFFIKTVLNIVYIMLNIMSFLRFLKNQPGRTAENDLAVVVLLPT